MNTTNQQEKDQIISDVSSDEDARELANLGKKPVLRVRQIPADGPSTDSCSGTFQHSPFWGYRAL